MSNVLNQNYMNSVERGRFINSVNRYRSILMMYEVVQYARSEMIPQEAPHEIEDKKPEPSWPQHGAIKFEDISMSYRPGLPDVLKGISLDVKGGEKIGVVGR